MWKTEQYSLMIFFYFVKSSKVSDLRAVICRMFLVLLHLTTVNCRWKILCLAAHLNPLEEFLEYVRVEIILMVK